jgi:hypothetical protein
MAETKLTLETKDLKGIQGGQDEPVQVRMVPLNGKLVTAEDPLIIGQNFRTLINMRYGDSSPKSIAGMTKINTTPLTTYTKVRSAFHFRKNYLSER